MEAAALRRGRKKRVFIWLGTAVVMLAALSAPIRVRGAVNVSIADEAAAAGLEQYAGQSVTLLCEYADHQVTAPPRYEFSVLAVSDEQGVLVPFSVDTAGNPVGRYGLYVSPKHFIGGAVKKYNYGFRNRFVLRGVLEAAPATKEGSGFGDFRMKLDSWDIVCPVYHFEYLDAGNARYRNSIFLFDYILP